MELTLADHRIVHSTTHMNVHTKRQPLKEFDELYNLFHIVNNKQKGK